MLRLVREARSRSMEQLCGLWQSATSSGLAHLAPKSAALRHASARPPRASSPSHAHRGIAKASLRSDDRAHTVCIRDPAERGGNQAAGWSCHRKRARFGRIGVHLTVLTIPWHLRRPCPDGFLQRVENVTSLRPRGSTRLTASSTRAIEVRKQRPARARLPLDAAACLISSR